MTEAAIQIVAVGSTCGVAAVAAFSGAVRETFRLQALRQSYDDIVSEPVPERFTDLLKDLK